MTAPGTRVHLVIGPVGAGKSTYARALAREHRAVRLALDEWMATLFRPDRPETGVIEWYVERAARCVQLIGAIAITTAGNGTDVVLEIGLLSLQQRLDFYARLDEARQPFIVHVLDAPRDVRRARVLRRNEERGETFSMVVPLEVFERASDLWEPPQEDERARREFRDVSTTEP